MSRRRHTLGADHHGIERVAEVGLANGKTAPTVGAGSFAIRRCRRSTRWSPGVRGAEGSTRLGASRFWRRRTHGSKRAVSKLTVVKLILVAAGQVKLLSPERCWRRAGACTPMTRWRVNVTRFTYWVSRARLSVG